MPFDTVPTSNSYSVSLRKALLMKKSSNSMDMTEGIIWKQLVLFALPLLAGNVFQQLYNTVDSIVVGNFVGPDALGAVTSVAPAINTLVGLLWECLPEQVLRFPSISEQKTLQICVNLFTLPLLPLCFSVLFSCSSATI